MAKKQYGLGHTRLTVPGRPDLTNKTAVVMVGDKTLEEALEECVAADHESKSGKIDAGIAAEMIIVKHSAKA